jgi:outer membrane protein assembly factor BamD
MKKSIWMGCLLILVIYFSGCAWFGPEKEKSAEELNEEALEYYEDKRYPSARESFEKLKDWYPFSEYATDAELKIADIHYLMEEYEEAVYAYREFEELHPTNEKTPYAIYQIGRCYFVQVDTVDRDQTSAQKAFHSFERFIKNYPENVNVPQAMENMVKCMQSIAGHESYVGHYYFKVGQYKAALQRFHNVIKDYPDVGYHKDAIEYIQLCHKKINEETLEEEKGRKENPQNDQENDQEEE